MHGGTTPVTEETPQPFEPTPNPLTRWRKQKTVNMYTKLECEQITTSHPENRTPTTPP